MHCVLVERNTSKSKATDPAPSSHKINTVMKKKNQFPLNEMDHKFSKIIIWPLPIVYTGGDCRFALSLSVLDPEITQNYSN